MNWNILFAGKFCCHSIGFAAMHFQLILRCTMKLHGLSLFAAGVVCFAFGGSMHAQQSPAGRMAEIQAALRDAKLDGWLFYDFRHSDPLTCRILKLDEKIFARIFDR
jgi:hypothetical protein